MRLITCSVECYAVNVGGGGGGAGRLGRTGGGGRGILTSSVQCTELVFRAQWLSVGEPQA